jgi:hypothetical protein
MKDLNKIIIEKENTELTNLKMNTTGYKSCKSNE